jgi:serine/threonine-protein kinase
MVKPQTMLNGRYRVGRKLGDGGMAVVHLGHDLLLGRDVAVKTLRPQFAADPSVRARFAREAHAAASLAHPNIIDVYDVGEDAGAPYIVMELVRGQSLREIIAAEAPFHPDDVAELLAQVAAALDYAHARGYVHRDVKPGNILVDEHGRVRVVDFGIAKGLADADLTAAGDGFGTAAYLSPEQAEGLMATPASDVYSLGVVAFELLTGRLPFTAESPVGLAMRHLHDEPPAPSAVMAGVPPRVDAIVLRALAKDPTRRWPSAGAFARALADWRHTTTTRHQTVSPPAPAAPAGSLVPTAIIAALVVAALAALLWLGLRPALLSDGAETPTPILVPDVPVITGSVPEEPTAPIPAIAPARETPRPLEAATEAPAVAPTIAPVGGGGIAVPDLRGQTIGEATAALLPRGLRVALDQTVFSETVPLNAIVSQEPAPGALAADGQIVRVILSRGPSPFPADQP